jgi:predicted peptidase
MEPVKLEMVLNRISGKSPLHGPFKEIRVNKHTMCFTVNGKQECFIVIGPQVSSTSGISETQFLNIYNHIIKTYRIDMERIYLTGLSMGGEGTYRRAGDASNTPNVFAALGIMSASIGKGTAMNVGYKNIPIWAHHGDKDNSFHSYEKAVATMEYINSVNPNPPPIFTVYPRCWS